MDMTDIRVRQFLDGLAILDQEKRSKLRNAVTERRVKGKDFTVDNITNTKQLMDVVTDPYGETTYINSTPSRRTASMVHFTQAELVATEDLLEVLNDPRPAVAEILAILYNRRMDDSLIDAMVGDAYGGEAGATTIALPSAQKIAHGSAALSLAKFKDAHRILLAGHVDMDREQITGFIDSEGYYDLVADTGLVSIDNVGFKTNMDGTMPMVAGIKLESCEALNYNVYAKNSVTTTNRLAIVVAKSAVELGIARDLTAEVDKAVHRQNQHQILAKATFGAVRRHDTRVVDIRFQ